MLECEPNAETAELLYNVCLHLLSLLAEGNAEDDDIIAADDDNVKENGVDEVKSNLPSLIHSIISLALTACDPRK